MQYLLHLIEVDVSKVRVAELVGDEALEWAKAKDVDIDDEGNILDTSTVSLPPLPFTASSKPNKAFGRKLKAWFKQCLSKLACNYILRLTDSIPVDIHGITSWKNDTWRIFAHNTSRYFENMPTTKSGAELRMTNFEQMDPKHLEIWRDHLIQSIRIPPTTKTPFRFKRGDGTTPKISKLRGKEEQRSDQSQEVDTTDVEASPKRTIKGKGRQHKPGKNSSGKDEAKRTTEAITADEHEALEEEQVDPSDGSDRKVNVPAKRPRSKRIAGRAARAGIAIALGGDSGVPIAGPSSSPRKSAAEPLPAKRLHPGSVEQHRSKRRKVEASPGASPSLKRTKEQGAVPNASPKVLKRIRAAKEPCFTFQPSLIGGLSPSVPESWYRLDYDETAVS
jgi:hypothetical protein